MKKLSYDIVIKHGRIFDGSGNPWYHGDIGISKGKIASIGRININLSNESIDAKGLVVTPGFIDSHSHADSSTIFYRQMENAIMQGITTVIAGQCGSSLAPVNQEYIELIEKRIKDTLPPEYSFKISWSTFEEYLKEEEKAGLGANVAHMVGHGVIRVASMGMEAREPTKKELENMKMLTMEAMEAGAFGLSTGLIYPPGIFSTTEEIIELSKIVSQYGGVYDSHIRGEGKTLIKALKEAIRIGREAKLPIQISHHKAANKAVWGKSVDTLSMMEEARKEGIDITVDQYPYLAGATSLITLLPPWAHEGGIDSLLERLRDPQKREAIRKDIENGIEGWENFAGELGWENIFLTSVKTDDNKHLEGKNLVEIPKIRREPDAFTSLFDIVLEEEGAVGMVIFSMKEDDVQRIMKHPLHMVGTDSGSCAPSGFMRRGKPHPRHYGTYPRILGRYVRDKGVLTLGEAIRKMTSMPAQRFGLLHRGILRPGLWADITIFNPDTVTDKSTYQDPHRFPEGIEYVIVNGKVTVEKGSYIGTLSGKTLRKSAILSK